MLQNAKKFGQVIKVCRITLSILNTVIVLFLDFNWTTSKVWSENDLLIPQNIPSL